MIGLLIRSTSTCRLLMAPIVIVYHRCHHRFPRLLRGAAPRGAHSSRVPHIITTGFPGSSWGESRIARLAYSDPMKVGLMQKAFRFFKELECDQHEVAAADPEQSSEKRTVLHKTACLDVGDCGDEFVLKSLKGLMATYEKLGLGYEVGFYARDGLDGKLRWAVQSSAQGVDGTVVDAATQRESDIEKLVRLLGGCGGGPILSVYSTSRQEL